ncbi:epimerase [Pullulanibacillus camelliae]|uniref:Epimerase n=1 Tax=Pullulanibacillus camelliae TaxID=1707096 RepID=A0A8J3E0S9_9BACL|nr:epimerase [Pullulanibacillus camelliae]
MTRGVTREENHLHYVHWDAKERGDWWQAIEGCEILLNLTGKSIHCVYNETNREVLLRSRIDAVKALQEYVLTTTHPPRLFIQASAVGRYGNTYEPCTEGAPVGKGFLAELCKRWEETFFHHDLPATRQVVLRIGLVLGKSGGALEPLKKLTKYHLGGTVGSGKQVMSWIHSDDLQQILLYVIENDQCTGAYNACAPMPVTNKVFMKRLRTVMHKTFALPAPAFLVKIGAPLVLRTDSSIALEGTYSLPTRLLKSGFAFTYKELKTALEDLV